MFVDFHFDGVRVGARILWPQVVLVKAYAVKRLLGKTVATIGKRFGIAERPANAFHLTGLAAHVPGRSQMRLAWHVVRIAGSDAHRLAGQTVLNAGGVTLWVDEEAKLDAVTAVSGSGPAYFFLLMEAMIDAGTELGLDRATSTQLTLQTAYGAALMAQQSDDPPAVLRQNVTSPGGTTAAALEVMTQHEMPGIIRRALAAADNRAGELAQEFGAGQEEG